MKKLLKTLLVVLAALALAAVCELLLFNRLSVCSLGREWTPLPAPGVSGDLAADRALTLSFRNIGAPVSSCHLEIAVRDADGEPVATNLHLSISDDGSSGFQSAGDVSYFPTHNKGAYFRLNSYGALHELSVKLTTLKSGCTWQLLAAEINGSVPFRISLPRLAALFAFFLLLYCLRPGSAVYDNALWNRRRWAKRLCVLLILLLNLLLLANLVQAIPNFTHPPENTDWMHHRQYAKLARALSEGRTWIDTEADQPGLELLAKLRDPYNGTDRYALFGENGRVPPWDTAYHGGHLYVYFGVVPALLTYLPYYLITGGDLPNSYAVLFSFALVLLGAFLLLRSLIRRWFPKTPFAVYLLLSVFFGNCTCVLLYSLAPSFYVLPICFSLAFVCFALALWLSAAERWLRLRGMESGSADAEACFPLRGGTARPGTVNLQILLGSLFAALTAGCRPQFLVFSALALPILWPLVRRERRPFNRLARLLLFALPYLAVALPLMYYNQIRFGSPFDFGANYNLTTNNMPLRGWNWSRLPDGLLDYLLRFPSVDLRFPWIHEAGSGLAYLGLTIREPMYGGVLLLHPFLWLLFGWYPIRAELKKLGLRTLTLLPPALALIVIAADTEMAGILVRYTGDFLPLLYFAATLIFLTHWQRAEAPGRKRLTLFLLVTLLATLAVCFLMSVNDSYLLTRYPSNYFRLKDLLSWS